MQYWFRVGTVADLSGSIENSGWINTPSWTVPTGALQNGVTYYWVVYTKTAADSPFFLRPSAIQKFRIDLRLGASASPRPRRSGPRSSILPTAT